MKQVLLLFSDDFPEHEEVVHNFASYLDHRCGCDVSLELWQPCTEPNQINWIIGEIRKAHSIIVIASEGAYKKHEARMQNVSRKQLLSRVTLIYSISIMQSDLLCFIVAINIRFLVCIHLYSSGLLHWHHGILSLSQCQWIYSDLYTLTPGLGPANERRRCNVTASPIGWNISTVISDMIKRIIL